MFWDNYVRLCNLVGKAPNVVAAEIGIKSSGTVTGWKNGAGPREATLQKLSQYFGVTVEYLLTGEGQKESPLPDGNGLGVKELLGHMTEQELLDVISQATQMLQEKNKA